MAIATLDEISDKRAILGIGAGISGFAELGIDRKKPPRAIREAIELIRVLLRGRERSLTRARSSSSPKASSASRRSASEIPVYVASNGPIGQKTAGAVADGAIMEACGNVEEVKAFRAVLERGREARPVAIRDAVKLVARLNTCIARGRQVGARCVAADGGPPARRG